MLFCLVNTGPHSIRGMFNKLRQGNMLPLATTFEQFSDMIRNLNVLGLLDLTGYEQDMCKISDKGEETVYLALVNALG